MSTPDWVKPVALVVYVLLIAILLTAQISVMTRFVRDPHGYDQSRLHWNTKNVTRFMGDDLATVASRVSRAVYPATMPANTPDVVLLYAPDDWQGGLAMASLLRPLNAVLLPAVSGVEDEIDRLNPQGSDALGGATVALIDDAVSPDGLGDAARVLTADIPALMTQVGRQAEHAILVDLAEPETALLAAPWVAYSGDRIIFDADDAPDGVPVFALGALAGIGDVVPISADTPAALAVALAKYDDASYPFFGWGMNAKSLTGYRAYTLARPDMPAMALLSANLSRRGKPGPLLWAGERELPTVVNNYLWSQRAAFWLTPTEGPFHHFYLLGGLETISFPAQGQADYAVEIGPYLGKGVALSEIDMVAVVWVVLGIAWALWIALHEVRILAQQNWIMKLAWPLLAFMLGPFGILLYMLAYRHPIIRRGKMTFWDRPIWVQGLVATASGVAFGGAIMVVTGWVFTLFGLPVIPSEEPVLFLFGAPMIISMIANYVVAIIVSWLLFQTPMLAMFWDMPYTRMLPRALPVVIISMSAVSLAMFPGMWWLMMIHIPMMPSEESILWVGTMFFTVFMGFLIAWPFNYWYVRARWKSGMM
jgi:hypothetical protein